MTKKRPTVHLEGTAKHKKTKTAVNVDAKITDSVYEFEIMADDIRAKRLWLDDQSGDDGWVRLLYSADGPTGDPIPVGKIKFEIRLKQLDPNFGDFSNLKLDESHEE